MRKTNKASSHLQIKISLMESPVPIWRRLLIEPDMTLDLVHEVFQIAMGWWNYHLYEFRLGVRKFGDLDEADGDETVEDSSEFDLNTLLKKPGDRFFYDYDFGDDWTHEVVFERRTSLSECDEPAWAKCLHGRRACPPEDCFGVDGYADLIAAIEDPLHPKRKEHLEWIGCDFDPNAFDPRIVNLRLHQWEREIKEEYMIMKAIAETRTRESNNLILLPHPKGEG